MTFREPANPAVHRLAAAINDGDRDAFLAVGIARCGNGHRAGLVGRADRGAFFSAVSRLVPATR